MQAANSKEFNMNSNGVAGNAMEYETTSKGIDKNFNCNAWNSKEFRARAKFASGEGEEDGRGPRIILMKDLNRHKEWSGKPAKLNFWYDRIFFYLVGNDKKWYNASKKTEPTVDKPITNVKEFMTVDMNGM